MILITGNAGFIGKYLTGVLLEKGETVRGIDIRPRKDILFGFVQVDGNILERSIVRQAMKDVDTMIHLAAEHKDFGVAESDYFRVNEQGTRAILEEASNANIKKLIFYSSVAVYGAQSNTTEETPPVPNNHYGASKLAAERCVTAWAKENSSRTAIIIRPTVVFGPHSKANIFRLIRQVCDGRFLMVGSGENVKSIAYVRNLVDATIYLKDRCEAGLHIFNYADEPHMQTRELVALIASQAGRKPQRLYVPLLLAEAGGYIFDIVGKLTGIDFPLTAARMKKFTVPTFHQADKIRDFGFIPRYSIKEGLDENIKWYKAGGARADDESESSE
ncbi:MAG: NAD-dependent epimerase/dehydratase family protein [Ignavibacteriales bacterium]|nr:NAD-dependent epimerase/dehydratase family protein [Ignavibacteriales bacterium]